MFPSPSILSSLVHVIFGVGSPVALQWNVTVEFSMTIWLEGLVVKLVSTEKVINDDQNDNVNDKDIYSQNLAKQFSPCPVQSPRNFSFRIRNPGKFCSWNPEFWALESGKQLKESGIHERLESRIQAPLTKTRIQYLASGIHSVESRIQDCLGFPCTGDNPITAPRQVSC